ncbi:hypothetical protein P43SY_000254 [Pythium insidiosum]|uniref:Transmembrane protein n=1 Tax=Pythium insidiosum TaxID=114742 RepID=A0AAD5Q8L0_PYTIN|nr:hypothetical protein P43SY_000254 [Pythium insidiosum]
MRWESRLGLRLRLRAAARRLSATAFLEKFRHGPDTQSEWNLFLWRVSFPMIPLMLFTALAVLGQCGHLVYSFLVCPVWYFSHLVLVAHPFLIVFRFENVDVEATGAGVGAADAAVDTSDGASSAPARTATTTKSDPHGRRVWQGLALLSVLLSTLEWGLSTPLSATAAAAASTASTAWSQRQHHAWIAANTLFGLVTLVAVPRFFFRQKRRAARDATCQPQRGASGALYLPPVSPSTPTHTLSSAEDGKPSDPFASSGDETDDASALLLDADPPSNTGVMPRRSPAALWRWFVEERGRLAQSRLLLLCAFCASALWTAMVASYTSSRRLEANLAYWFAVYLLSPLACALLWLALRQTDADSSARPRASTFSFEHVVTYSVLVVHLPACLGHLCFRLFTLVEMSDPAHSADAAAGSGLASASSALSLSATTSWMKLATSMLFLLVMQGYFHVMTRVVNAMSEPYAHPSLLYLGQLYYYLFWYVLVGSDTPIDMLYWGQLLLNYVHIALLNTGIYSDVKASSTSCCSSVPSPLWGLLSESNASVLMCFRATMIKASGDHEHASGEEEDDDADDLERAAHELLIGASDADDTHGVQHRPSQRRSASVAVSSTDAPAFLLGRTDDDEDDDKTHKKPTRKKSKANASGARPSRHRSLSMIAASARALLPFSGASAAAAAAASSSAATIYFAPAAACVSDCASSSHSSACSLCRASSSSSLPDAAADHRAHRHRHRHHSTDSTDSATPPPSSSSSGSYRARSHRTSSRLHQHKAAPSEHMRQLYFLMKLAEQDNMADTTALILVPSLLTLLAVLDKPSQGLAILLDQMNLWLRCICMFIGRLGGAYLAREIFTYKLRRRLRQQQADRRGAFSEELLHNIGGLSTRLWIQKLMLQDFHRQFWYLTMVTVVVTFACFERMELPARFAFLN